jgi:hypothetical protein
VQENSPSLAKQFDKVTARIPWLGKQYIASRVFFIAALCVALLCYVLAEIFRRSDHEILTETVWCADTVMVGVNRLQPNTLGIIPDYSRRRVETFQLLPNGKAILPGFNTEAVRAKWRTEDIYIEIYDCDTFGNVYNNVYEYYLTPEFLKLVSEDVLISGSRDGAY